MKKQFAHGSSFELKYDAFVSLLKNKIPHTGDTESLDRCGLEKLRYLVCIYIFNRPGVAGAVL